MINAPEILNIKNILKLNDDEIIFNVNTINNNLDDDFVEYSTQTIKNISEKDNEFLIHINYDYDKIILLNKILIEGNFEPNNINER